MSFILDLTVNGEQRKIALDDPRVTLLDLLRERLDLTGTKSLAEAQAKIAEYVKANPGRKWILGGGWNQESWGLGRFPTAAELDAVTGDVPTWLERVDGHAGWANSAAMKAAGVTPATKAPPGGRIEAAGGDESLGGVVARLKARLVTERRRRCGGQRWQG